jgi:hypothetical protein
MKRVIQQLRPLSVIVVLLAWWSAAAGTPVYPFSLSISVAGGNARITVSGTPGQSITLQGKPSLSTPVWTDLATGTLDGAGVYQFTEAASSAAQFFRSRDSTGGPVYSVNLVGYVNFIIPPGGDFIANPLLSLTNTAGALLPSLPDGVSLFKAEASGFVANNFLGTWQDPAMLLRPGEGFFVRNPFATSLNLTLVGEILQGTLVVHLPAGTALAASMVPQTGALQTSLGYPATDGDVVLIYNPVTGNQDLYFYDFEFWDPFEPTLNFGHSFWSSKSAPADWTRNFSQNFSGASAMKGAPVGGPGITLPPIPVISPGQVNFFTYNPDAAHGRVFDLDTVTPATSGLSVQLYAGTNATEASLARVGSAAPFQAGAGAGYVQAGVVSIPPVSPGQTVYYQLRVWETAWGATYEAAAAAGGKRGKSAIVSAVAGGGIAPPPNANGFANFSLQAPPTITAQPQSQSLQAGSDAALSVSATGDVPLNYQWQFNGATMIDATNASLTLLSVQPAQAGGYRVVVSNAYGMITSAVATLTVLLPPTISQPPASFSVPTNTRVTNCVAATGGPPLTYQWRKNGVNLAGATNACLILPSVQVPDGGTYSVLVANAAGAVLSAPAVLTFSDLPQGPPAEDFFANRNTLFDSSGELSVNNVGATREPGEPNHAGKRGGSSVWYEWQAPATGIATFRTVGSGFDTLLAVYTGTSLDTLQAVVSDEDRGGFLASELRFNAQANATYVVAIDGLGGQSGSLVLTWQLETTTNVLPVIATQPVGATVEAGTNYSFSVAASSPDARPLSYQWFFLSNAIAWGTGPVLTVTNVQPTNAGAYVARVSNGLRSVDSVPAFLEIGPASTPLSRDKLVDVFFLPGSGASGLARGATANAVASPNAAGFVPVTQGTTVDRDLNNTGAGSEPGEPAPCGVSGGASIWYGLSAADDGVLVVDTAGSAIATAMAVYTTTTNLTTEYANPYLFYALLAERLVACDTNSAPDGHSQVGFVARRGTNYLVQIDGIGGQQGRIKLNYEMVTLPVLGPTNKLRLMAPGSGVVLSALATNPPTGASFRWKKNGSLLTAATDSQWCLVHVGYGHGGTYSVELTLAGRTTNYVVTRLAVGQLDYRFDRVAGRWQLSMTARASQGSTIEASADLLNWTPMKSETRTNTPFSLGDTLLDQARRVYRLRPLP